MTDIFISYSRADREVAKIFADAFAAQSWTVWWDPEILVGTQYDKAIEHELARARCVVVLWSKRSVESQWVRSEAAEGNQRGILVPIRIEANAKEPLEFRKVQTAELARWDGDRKDPTFEGVIRGIEHAIHSRASTPRERIEPLPAESRASADSPTRRMFFRLGLLAAPTLVALILAAIAMLVHRPTTFDLDLTVTKLSFVSAADQAAEILGKTAFAALDLHGIERGTINAKRAVLVEDGGNASVSPLMSAGSASLSLPIEIFGRNATGASVMFSGLGSNASASGELDRLFLPPGRRIELEVTQEDPPAVSVRIPDQPSRIVLSMRGELILQLVGAKIDVASQRPLEASTLTLRVEGGDGSLAEMATTASGPTVLLTPFRERSHAVEFASNLKVSVLDFQTQSPTGAAVTTVSSDGTISFHDAPEKPKIVVKDRHYVVLGDPENFFIRRLKFQPERKAIHLEAGGVAGSLKSGPAGGVQERALTWFDSIWNQPGWVQLFGLVVWLFPTTLAGYKLAKELRQ